MSFQLGAVMTALQTCSFLWLKITAQIYAMLTENGTYAVSSDARVPAWGFCVSIFLNPQGECRNVLFDCG